MNNEVEMIDDEIISIECIGEEDTIDIETDGNHLFFANGVLTHNSSVGVDDLDQSHIAGGISKVNTADLLFGIITNNTMKEKGQYYLQVLKSRNSTGTGRKIPIIMNTETMRMYDDPEFLNTINSNMNKSISEANKSLDNTELENTMNEIQDALNKDDQSYTPVGESSTGDSSDDKLGELKSLIDKANRGA